MRVLTVIGARPQFIKAGAVSKALREAGIEELLVHTGQHYDHGMSQVFFDELGISTPAVNLGVGSGSHAEQTAGMLVGIEKAIVDHKPDCVMIYGDTNSTVAGALAATKLHVPVAHVEAGLRSFNRMMPEEINRIVADAISNVLFVPTETGLTNLRREGVPDARIHVVGDVMYDAALMYGEAAESRSTVLKRMALDPRSYVLATMHRAENTDSEPRLRVIAAALAEIGRKTRVLLPIHPRTRNALRALSLAEELARHVEVIDPVGYLDMIMLERNAAVIVTDSGGVQKEAFFYRVPCVTLRDETEWIESVELGWNRLCPPESVSGVTDAVTAAVGSVGRESNPYGDGNAGPRIAGVLGGGHQKACVGRAGDGERC